MAHERWSSSALPAKALVRSVSGSWSASGASLHCCAAKSNSFRRPKSCPDCRFQRRLAQRYETALHRRKCDLSGAIRSRSVPGAEPSGLSFRLKLPLGPPCQLTVSRLGTGPYSPKRTNPAGFPPLPDSNKSARGLRSARTRSDSHRPSR